MPPLSSNIKEAYETARKARENAHAPYSGFTVGVALKLLNSNELVTGCNVENASYGLTLCAERNAFAAAIVKYRILEPEFMVIVSETTPPSPPCGACLQFMAEFCQPGFEIYLANTKGIQERLLLKDLMPRPFQMKFWSVKS
ncbi:MAG: cytidine deaminase [Opitutales bacterium]|nr:cytidine deaminase [Opitutales bacterium]